MPGQFKIRRNAETGRIESIPEAEQGALRAAAQGIEPPSPAAGTVTQQDIDFVDGPGGLMQSEAGAPPVQPPPLPPKAPPVQPPVIPVAETAEAATAGAATAGVAGGAGAAAILLATQAVSTAASKKGDPIGTLEGKTVTQTDEGTRTLQELLNVTKQIEREGSPIKGAVSTIAQESKI